MPNKMFKSWEVTVQEDPDDPEGCIIPFPEELIEQLGWKEGDAINWEVLDHGIAILTRAA